MKYGKYMARLMSKSGDLLAFFTSDDLSQCELWVAGAEALKEVALDADAFYMEIIEVENASSWLTQIIVTNKNGKVINEPAAELIDAITDGLTTKGLKPEVFGSNDTGMMQVVVECKKKKFAICLTNAV